jgi:hypothetical protein
MTELAPPHPGDTILRKSFTARLIVAIAMTLSIPSSATTVTYADLGTFTSALAASFYDDYESDHYATVQTDAQMSAVMGQTRYQATSQPDVNRVLNAGGSHRYCAGCNGGFTLSFDQTGFGDARGVYGVGLNIFENQESLYDALVTFGDGSSQIFAGLTSGSFFGVTSDDAIQSIAFGPTGGAASDRGSFAIDNLTIGSGGAVIPELSTWAMMMCGLALIGGAIRRRSVQPVRAGVAA